MQCDYHPLNARGVRGQGKENYWIAQHVGSKKNFLESGWKFE